MALMLVFGLFYAMGLSMLGAVAWWAFRSRSAAQWPTVRGTIRAVSIRQGGKSRRYHLTAKYGYAVEGKSYIGKRIAFGFSGRSDASLARLYKKLKRATSVDVRFNPSNPAECCLSYGWHTELQILLLFACMWLVFTTGMYVFVATAFGSDTVLLEHLRVH